MEKSINYHDAVVYRRDVANFCDGCWLNDSCINFCWKYFEFAKFPEKHHIYFMDPSLMSYVKLQIVDDDDVQSIRSRQRLTSRSYIFVPCNDNMSFETSSSHWSLLVINAQTGESFHFDSHAPTNRVAAVYTYQKLKILFDW